MSKPKREKSVLEGHSPEAVYSDDLTTDTSGKVVPIPYFIHITRRQNTQLFEKHKQLEACQRDNLELQQAAEGLNETINLLKNDLTDKQTEIERLEGVLQKAGEDRQRERERFQADIDDLHSAIDDNKEEIQYLSNFKKGYDDLAYAFTDQPEGSVTPRAQKKPIVSTKRLAKKLEEQIMTVLNTAVEEFDKFMEGHKAELLTIETKEDQTDAEFDAQQIDIDNADQQLEAIQERFRSTIGDISNELLLLKQHSTMLMEQLQILEETHPTIMRVKRVQEESIKIQEIYVKSPFFGLNDEQWKELQDSILSAGLGDDEDEDDSDPFIPQERVFSKYAAMVYTSNNQGKSFEEFKDAKFCPSCGEKVELLKAQDEEDVTFDFPSSVGKMDASRDHSLRGGPGSVMSLDSSRDGLTSAAGSETHMVQFGPKRYSIASMFDDYKQRTNLERDVPRPISMDRCLSLVEQFWTFVIWEDDNGKEEDIHNSIMDKLYSFMEERYMVKDIMFLCNYDFLSALAEYSEQEKLVQLFAHILVGNLEGACFRYMMLLSDFISAVDWKEVEDFRAFASVVYPFLQEDDLETLQMSYTSYSENKISRNMVAQFIIHLILKYREPRFQDMENRLMPFHTQQAGKQAALSEREFKEAIDNILPLTNNKLRRRLYFEAEKMGRREGLSNSVSVMRLAQIASFLGLLNITNIVNDTIAARVAKWRERPSSSGSARQPQEHESQLLHDDDIDLITLRKVKLLSANISRRKQLRQERYDMDDQEW
ncbi:hypothetical protein MAR_016311 [Mya arenaria]|uniref:Uncharacterized protein n=1 Tax=Mya arenaria TaxID=6604 RepID=A0ABY7FL81_MYAAR|nr:hypothetical protein MAR_016311 [Mya arenaria]